LEHIIQNDCVYIDCGKCPIKRECNVPMIASNYNGHKEIAKKALDKIKVEMMQEILS
jgi:hypothetical protein